MTFAKGFKTDLKLEARQHEIFSILSTQYRKDIDKVGLLNIDKEHSAFLMNFNINWASGQKEYFSDDAWIYLPFVFYART